LEDPRWEDNIKIQLKEIGCALDSSGLGSCEHGSKPSGFIKCWVFLDKLSNY
jgi:hypothetical protein